MKTDLYATVAARIVAELETGAAPWVRPWRPRAGGNVPQNAVTGRPYSGGNVVLLWITCQNEGYDSARFLTFKQAKEAGGTVKAGSKGYKVYFVKQLQVKDKTAGAADDAIRNIPMMREYTVFHVSQCEGLPERIVEGPAGAPRTIAERNADADAFISCTGALISEGAGEAFYRPSSDSISLPLFAAFKSADHYYATAFHELSHWTGAKGRLDRDLRNRFGTDAYAAEELVAELSAAFLCAEFGFEGDLRHAGYIAHWIRLLKADPRAFFTAASAAQKAADYLRGLALSDGEASEAA